MPIKNKNKKRILAKKGRQTKWAPVWAVLKNTEQEREYILQS